MAQILRVSCSNFAGLNQEAISLQHQLAFRTKEWERETIHRHASQALTTSLKKTIAEQSPRIDELESSLREVCHMVDRQDTLLRRQSFELRAALRYSSSCSDRRGGGGGGRGHPKHPCAACGAFTSTDRDHPCDACLYKAIKSSDVYGYTQGAIAGRKEGKNFRAGLQRKLGACLRFLGKLDQAVDAFMLYPDRRAMLIEEVKMKIALEGKGGIPPIYDGKLRPSRSTIYNSEKNCPPLAAIKPIGRPKPPLGVILKKRPPINGEPDDDHTVNDVLDDEPDDDHTNDPSGLVIPPPVPGTNRFAFTRLPKSLDLLFVLDGVKEAKRSAEKKPRDHEAWRAAVGAGPGSDHELWREGSSSSSY